MSRIRLAHRLEQIEASVRTKETTIKEELAAIRSELQSDSIQSAKADFLKLKVEQFDKQYDALLAEKSKQVNLLKDDLRNSLERMRGLLAYGIANGGLNPDASLLFDSLGDVLDAKSDSDRQSAEKAVFLTLEHGRFAAKLLARFESIRDPELASAFYRKHQTAIQSAFSARHQKQLEQSGK
jgi:hypothetical protein